MYNECKKKTVWNNICSQNSFIFIDARKIQFLNSDGFQTVFRQKSWNPSETCMNSDTFQNKCLNSIWIQTDFRNLGVHWMIINCLICHLSNDVVCISTHFLTICLCSSGLKHALVQIDIIRFEAGTCLYHTCMCLIFCVHHMHTFVSCDGLLDVHSDSDSFVFTFRSIHIC